MERVERIRGALLGLAVGDALGARFEARSAASIAERYPTTQALVDAPPTELLRYTDDTQLTIAVCEALLARPEPEVEDYARAYVANYEPWRGYGRGARAALDALEEGVAPALAATSYFEGGSFGNGAAMRVAPIGLRFAGRADAVTEHARRSALPTHSHPLGVEGAVLLAHAVAYARAARPFARGAFFDGLDAVATSVEFQGALAHARRATASELGELGNEISALRSVPTALAAFACHAERFADAVGAVILLGGDTDTLAAMTGALSGAYLGADAIPASWLTRLEDDPGGKGRRYLETLARRLDALP